MTDQQRAQIEAELQRLRFARSHALALDPEIPRYDARIAELEAQLTLRVPAPPVIAQPGLNAFAASLGQFSVPPWILHVLLIVVGFYLLLFYFGRRGEQSKQGDRWSRPPSAATATPPVIAEWVPK